MPLGKPNRMTIMVADLKSMTCLWSACIIRLERAGRCEKREGKRRPSAFAVLSPSAAEDLKTQSGSVCLFHSICVFWVMIPPVLVWCNLFSPAPRPPKTGNLTPIFFKYPALKWLSDSAGKVCIACGLCMWCDCNCLYGVRDKTRRLVVM